MGKVIDLTNQTFGRLTVIKRVERIENNKSREIYWLCQCDCLGKDSLKIIRGSSLRNGHTKSCGCLQKEIVREISQISKNHNTYDLTGKYGIGYTLNNEEFYFDLEDYDKIKDYSWHINADNYVITGYMVILMHRLVMNCPDDMEVDPIFHNKNDNRKEFLRLVTRSQNSMNRDLQSNNTSGVTGVVWRKDKGKWNANIGKNGKYIHLGYFDNFEDAVNTRLKAEDEYFGEYKYKGNKK